MSSRCNYNSDIILSGNRIFKMTSFFFFFFKLLLTVYHTKGEDAKRSARKNSPSVSYSWATVRWARPRKLRHTRGDFNSEPSRAQRAVVVPQKTTNQQKTDARRQISSLLIKYKTESSSEYGDATEESEPCCGQPGQQLRPQREENLNRGKHRWVVFFFLKGCIIAANLSIHCMD